MKYRTTYEFTCKEYDSDNEENVEKEMLHHNVKVDATDYTLAELLQTMEDFLRSSGYDWIEQGSLHVKGYVGDIDPSMTDDDLEEFKEFVVKLNMKKPVEPDHNELAERLLGIDRTAKIVSLHPDRETSYGDPVAQEPAEEIIEPSAIQNPEPEFESSSDGIDINISYTFEENEITDKNLSEYQYPFQFQTIDTEKNIEDKKND